MRCAVYTKCCIGLYSEMFVCSVTFYVIAWCLSSEKIAFIFLELTLHVYVSVSNPSSCTWFRNRILCVILFTIAGDISRDCASLVTALLYASFSLYETV